MKKSFALNFNKVFFAAFLFLIIVNIIGTYSGDVLFLQTTKSLFVPALLILFFVSNKSLSLRYILFFVFSFLGDASLLLFGNQFFIKASSVFYLLSYLCLIGVAISKLKSFKVDKIVAVYLIVVFLINTYFLYIFYDILKVVVLDNLEVFLFGVKGFSLLILAFVSFVKYLSKDTKPAILFLMVAMCLVLSTILNYVNLYYVYNWSFVMIETVIYATGIYLLLNYVLEENKSTVIDNTIQDNYNSDNIFA